MERPTQQPPLSGWKRDLVLFLDRQIYYFARHWLAVFNALIGIYVLIPILAPVLMSSGLPYVGRLIYTVYRPACHQLPERSFFLFGPQTSYSLDELWAMGELSGTEDIFARQRFLGSVEVGFKMALCERDVALYGGLLVGGLVFGLIRRWLRPLSLLCYGICALPMAIDGGTQLFLLRESNWILRTLTGGLLGLASVWMLYPRLEEAFVEIRVQANERVGLDRSPVVGQAPGDQSPG